MAPEQLHAMLDPRRWAEVGPAVDIYALGLTLGELLLGELPDIPSGNLSESRAARELLNRRSRPSWPTRIAARVSAAPLAEIVERCLAVYTTGKYIDAGDIARSLGRFLAISETTPRELARSRTSPRRTLRRIDTKSRTLSRTRIRSRYSKSGMVITEEWKSSYGVWPSSSCGAPGVYFLLIEDELGVRPTHGFSVCRSGTRHRVDNSEALRTRVLERTDKIKTYRASISVPIAVHSGTQTPRRFTAALVIRQSSIDG